MARFFHVLTLVYLVASAALAQPIAALQVPASEAQMSASFAPVVRRVAPAVVNIFSRQHVRVQNPLSPFANDPLFKQFFGEEFGFDVPRERVVNSLGSGVIVSADGTILTSNHVIKGSEEIHVVLAGGREFTAKLVKADARSDLAVLKIEGRGEPLPYLQLRDSDTLEVGDLVLAIGNPFGIGQTVTHGIVSALARRARGVSDYGFFIQTDAAINPGNSGGALVDMQGRLVGINTAIYSTSGGSNGIGFAIPANMAKAVLSGKAQGTAVIAPSFGIKAQSVTPEIAQAMSLPAAKGALVKQVEAGSPAALAGIQPGDVIVGVDGKPVGDAHELAFREETSAIGHAVAIDLARGGKALILTLTPAETPSLPQATGGRLTGAHPLAGAGVSDITPALADEFGLRGDVKGVVVTAGNGRVQPGDLITAVNGTPITSTLQLAKLLSVPGRVWEISLNRSGAIMTLTVIGG